MFTLLLVQSPAAAQAPGGTPPACAADSTWHQLDFWVGEWRVTVDGKLDGSDRVEKILDGCAITESWRDVDGHAGKSLFFVTTVMAMKRWKQVWVTDQARATGGTKEKSMVARDPGGGVRFQGELIGPLGRILFDRTTLTPMPDGTVHQVIELSTDGGSTWRQSYDAIYTRITH